MCCGEAWCAVVRRGVCDVVVCDVVGVCVCVV